tara:strand:+ start:17521 stop:17940 length:420 start_codon:yes stop_codon:yes gene_type:complete
MNSIKVNDLKYGNYNESRVHPILEETFGDLINNNVKDKYAKIDFKNKEYAVEYKRRRINFGQYPTLMFNMNKIVKGKEYIARGKRVFYIWECNDGMYYWELGGEFTEGKGGTTRRGCNEIGDVAHIKNSEINKLSNLVL